MRLGSWHTTGLGGLRGAAPNWEHQFRGVRSGVRQRQCARFGKRRNGDAMDSTKHKTADEIDEMIEAAWRTYRANTDCGDQERFGCWSSRYLDFQAGFIRGRITGLEHSIASMRETLTGYHYA